MKAIRLVIFAGCMGFGPVTVFGQDYEKDVTKWQVVKPPGAGSDVYDKVAAREHLLDEANGSDVDWVITRKDGKLIANRVWDGVSKGPEFPDFDTTVQLQDCKAKAAQCLKVEGGWIAGYNQGEFGAAVYWWSSDGSDKRKLSDHQINQFIEEGGRIFAVEGLAHLSMSQGSFIEIKKKDDKWVVEEFLPLPASATAIARIAAGDFVIVTSDMLLRVNLNREILVLVPAGYWGGLYPNSIEVENGFIYIGMRQFVVRCKVSKAVENFDLLVPDNSWLNPKK